MKKTFFNLQFVSTLIFSLFSAMSAFAGSLVIEVPDTPEPTIESVTYQCNIGTKKERVEATYYDTDDIALVDLKWNKKRIIAANVIAASGAKYAGGEYIWWTKQNEALLYDLINDSEEGKPFRCVEEKDTK
ncbi:MliC family protein [Bartonella vinsonii]|uniref:Membrane-bound lysozyme inhibitor of C-type lysozyme n=1 Tax=Bartonella vinsonii TaxID=33047 RepID=A0A3S4ZBB2_BARVI|nr:MliC family protein [Bartonella vinsonii]VEJ44569.1 Membrane-bound lysozyme inhibitor of C-type lysozyme precursor [Bartonella vinsonii]